MTALLVVVTIVSLAIAGLLLIYVRQLTRAERDRSNASAAALADMIGPAHFGSATDAAPTTSAAMFGTAESAASSPPAFLVPAIGLVVVAAALTGVYLWNRPVGPGTVSAADVQYAALELVTLRHQRSADALVISGVVRNPHQGEALGRLSAVAFTFNREGRFLASGRAPIDFPRLQPGDESPFTVTVSNSSAIGRYRVSFRTEAGIVPHVDRRGDSPATVQQVSAR
jgi:hypothetical protein